MCKQASVLRLEVILVNVGIKQIGVTWRLTQFRFIVLGHTGKEYVVTDPENTVSSWEHIISAGSLCDSNYFLDFIAACIHKNQNCVKEVTFLKGSDLSHLTLDKHGYLLFFFVIWYAHTLVLVIKGSCSTEGVLTRCCNNPADIAIIFHTGYRSFQMYRWV